MRKKNDNHIMNFAFLGSFDIYKKKIIYLAEIAEEEDWSYEDSSYEPKYAVLYQYITHTFNRAYTNDAIVYTCDKSQAIINTGLLSRNGEDIYMHFSTNKKKGYHPYFFNTFRKASERELEKFHSKLPECVSFHNDSSDLFFDSKLKVIVNIDHIYNENFSRFPKVFQSMDKDTALLILSGAIDKTRKKVRRNNRLAVPQYYNGQITFLLPLEILQNTVPIAVEKIDSDVDGKVYRINTILTGGMAYCNARLIMKPESNWLKK